MKKIINGKRYNTETATLLASADNGFGVTDVERTEEELYQKKTGEFFLYGKSNPGGSYATIVPGGARMAGEGIRPITRDEAKQWAEKYLEADEYEELFEVEEDNNTVINVLVPESLHNRLRNQAEKQNVSQKDLIIKALESYLD